jgi:uncharacterized membrane protein YhdT
MKMTFGMEGTERTITTASSDTIWKDFVKYSALVVTASYVMGFAMEVSVLSDYDLGMIDMDYGPEMVAIGASLIFLYFCMPTLAFIVTGFLEDNVHYDVWSALRPHFRSRIRFGVKLATLFACPLLMLFATFHNLSRPKWYELPQVTVGILIVTFVILCPMLMRLCPENGALVPHLFFSTRFCNASWRSTQ